MPAPSTSHIERGAANAPSYCPSRTCSVLTAVAVQEAGSLLEEVQSAQDDTAFAAALHAAATAKAKRPPTQ